MKLDGCKAHALGLLTLVGLALCSTALAQSEAAAPQLQLGAPPGAEGADAQPQAPAQAQEPEGEQPNTESSQLPVPALSPEQAATGTQATFVTDAQLTADADRLEAAFVDLSEHNAIGATNIVAGFIVGGGLIAGGIYLATDEADVAEDEGLVALSGSMFVVGAGALANAIHSFWLRTPDQERITRFRAARARGTFDRVTLARFEGELKADAQAARFRRLATGIVGIGTVLGGGATIALAASSSEVNDDALSFGITLGTVFIVTGGIQALVNLAFESEHEEQLQKYQAPAPASPQVSIAPVIGARALGLSLKATL